jgi:hypothetical protein
VFVEGQFIDADFGLKMVEGINVPNRNRLPFSLLLSGARPDVNREASKRKEEYCTSKASRTSAIKEKGK